MKRIKGLMLLATSVLASTCITAGTLNTLASMQAVVDGRITMTDARFCEKGAEFMAKFYTDTNADGDADAVTVVWCDHHIQSFPTKVVAGRWPDVKTVNTVAYDGITWEGKREWMYVIRDSATGNPMGIEKKAASGSTVALSFYDAKQGPVTSHFPDSQPVITFKRMADGRGTDVHFEYYKSGRHALSLSVGSKVAPGTSDYYEYDIVTEGNTGIVDIQLIDVFVDSNDSFSLQYPDGGSLGGATD